MPINLQKGQKVSLTKDNPGLSKIVVGLGWDVNAFDTGGDFDLDTAAFLLTDTGKVSKSWSHLTICTDTAAQSRRSNISASPCFKQLLFHNVRIKPQVLPGTRFRWR